MKSSDYVKQERRKYSLYVIEDRSIPALTDGLKPSTRRCIWMARNGEKYKVSPLAGITMELHPHDAPEDSINTATAPYGNNIPYFTGYGAFGTCLVPNDYGAGRYTSVRVSPFTQDVVFKDLDIVPMKPNYDNSTTEPMHFLPLVPTVMINPISGIAVGFACNIVSRSLNDIVSAQIAYLKTGKVPNEPEPMPRFVPTNSTAIAKAIHPKSGNPQWTYVGKIEVVNSSELRITNLPYGINHMKYVSSKLDKLLELGKIRDYEDRSKQTVNITVKFGRGQLAGMLEEELIKLLELDNTETENFNVIDLDGSTVRSTGFYDVIERFTEWRLQWYIKRYEKEKADTLVTVQKLVDVITAIDNNVGGMARKMSGQAELIEFLEELKIVNTQYIANLPVTRFTEQEKQKTVDKLGEAQKRLQEIDDLLTDEKKRKKVYIQELQEVLKKYGEKK